MYVALEWDHKIGRPMIHWIVVQCSGVSEKCGGPIALAPRRDIAYFVSEQTAERDAKAFAAYKNAQQEGRAVFPGPSQSEGAAPGRHLAFSWDHQLFSPLLRWAVLEWGGKGGKPMPRTDVAYFLDPEAAEMDAKAFSWIREDWVREEAPNAGPGPA